MADAASAAKTGLFDEGIEGPFSSMRNPLDNASVAQSLDAHDRLMGSLQVPNAGNLMLKGIQRK